MVKIDKIIVGDLKTNCYLIYDEKLKESLIVDPGDDSDYIISRISKLELKPKEIIATHGHFDHILAVSELKLAYNIPFYMHNEDKFLLKRMKSSAEHFTQAKVLLQPDIDGFLKEREKLEIGKVELKIIHTPGHTPGSITLYDENEYLAFVGDLIFKGGFLGRHDFSYSNKKQLENSIKKISKFDIRTKIYSGHDEETTVMDLKKVLGCL